MEGAMTVLVTAASRHGSLVGVGLGILLGDFGAWFLIGIGSDPSRFWATN
jgi:hypothetical protein